MARGDQLSRQWKIIHILVASSQGKTVAELAATLACTPRTVYRDLEALQAAGFPLTTEMRDNYSYWHILNPNRQQPPMAFSVPELMALYLGKEMLKTYRGTIFFDAIESLLDKISATLPAAVTDYLDRIERHVNAGPAPRKDYTRFGTVINQINRAIIDERKIRIVYYSMSRQAESRRVVHPYVLRHVEDTLYLIGWCELRKEIRTFAVDRIRSAEASEQRFALPAAFDLAAFLQDSFGIYRGDPVRVKIRFLNSVAGYIRERVWHPSQTIEAMDDGSLIFSATVAGIEEIGHWVMRWGAGAEVLEPEVLRRRIAAQASAMAEHYRDTIVE
jgi:predicted DNA-binding transcriptional regulator YafY